jgi:hypothetical protein
MTAWIKRIHMYTGLINFTILLVFGIAGLTATLQPPRRQTGDIETRAFQVPPNVTDFEAATAAYQFLNVPLSQAPGRGAVRRDAENHVAFTMYSANGPRIVTLLEKEHQARIDSRKNSIWHFFENAHATTPRGAGPDLRERLWSWYTELSIWSLILMAVSGVYLWLASRPGHRWGQISFAAGSGAFLLLYALSR